MLAARVAVDAAAVTPGELVSVNLPSWALAVPFVVLASVGVFAAYRERQRMAGFELRRLIQTATLGDPGGDWATLVVRQGRRSAGRVIGLYVAFVGSIPLIGWSIYAGGRPGAGWPWPLILPVGSALGTDVGQLRPLPAAAPAARVAVVHRRQLINYVRPVEVAAAAVSTVLPVAAVVIAAVTLIHGTSTPLAAVIMALAAAVSLAILAVLWWVIRRVLRQPVTATTDAGLEWGEVLRSQLLRDQLGAVTFVCALGGGGGLLWGLTTGVHGLPDWAGTAVPLVATVCVIVIVILIVIGAALADRRFGWVRAHVLLGQHG